MFEVVLSRSSVPSGSHLILFSFYLFFIFCCALARSTDWVPVSSTVIPLVERVVSVGARTKPSTGADGSQHPGAARLQSADESYKRAYVKHISKFTKIGTAGALVQPGTLITGRNR